MGKRLRRALNQTGAMNMEQKQTVEKQRNHVVQLCLLLSFILSEREKYLKAFITSWSHNLMLFNSSKFHGLMHLKMIYVQQQ